jgi:hypothetical protein
MLRNGAKATRAELAAAVWGSDLRPGMERNALDQIMSDLRKTLQATRDLRLVRESGGYRLEVLDLSPSERATQLLRGQTFPRNYLLEPSLWIARCRTREMDCFVAAPQPLELEPEFGAAAFRHMEAGARYQMLLPSTELEHVGKLIHQLIASDLESDSIQASNLLERLLVLETQLRVSFTDEAALTAVHTQVYQADLKQNSIAVVVPPGSGDGFVYATESEASHLGLGLRGKMTADLNGRLMVGISATKTENARELVRRGVCRHLGDFAPVVRRVLDACG